MSAQRTACACCHGPMPDSKYLGRTERHCSPACRAEAAERARKFEPAARYEMANYGSVMACPWSRRLPGGLPDDHPSKRAGICFSPGQSVSVGSVDYYAIDSICFSKDIGAFTAEYDAMMRTYLSASYAIKAMRSWYDAYRESNEDSDHHAEDIRYAEWLVVNKCAAWPEVMKALQDKEDMLNLRPAEKAAELATEAKEAAQ